MAFSPFHLSADKLQVVESIAHTEGHAPVGERAAAAAGSVANRILTMGARICIGTHGLAARLTGRVA